MKNKIYIAIIALFIIVLIAYVMPSVLTLIVNIGIVVLLIVLGFLVFIAYRIFHYFKKGK